MIFTKKYIANPLILQYVILSMRNSYLKRKNLFFFLDLSSAVAKVLGMYCFSDRYRQEVGSYKKRKNLFLFLDLLSAVAVV
jgi:hypothetical protein